MENLASILKDSIMELVDNINNNPVLVTRLGNLVAKSGFNWSFMKAIICGLKEEWLMDKAIQMIVDTWDEYNDRDDERCKQSAGSYSYYDGDQNGIYEVKQSLSIPKYFNLKRELEGVKADELERRKVNEKFNKMMVPSVEQEEEPQFTYTDDTFKKSAMITDMQLDLMLAELIVNGWMPNDSSKSDFYKLFSSAKSEFTLTWSGKPGELHDFFDMLTKKKVGKRKKTDGYVTPRGNYLNIACSHFKNKRGKWFKNLKGQKHTDGTKDVLNSSRITTKTELKPVQTLLSIGGVSVIERGDIYGIKGKPKSGKTSANKALIGAALLGECCGVKAEKPDLKVAYLDTEQKPQDTQGILNYVRKMAGDNVDDYIDNYFQLFTLRKRDYSTLTKDLLRIIIDYRPDIIIADGIADFVRSFNDEEASKAWMPEGHSIPIPGLGSARFGLSAKSVADVNDVKSSLIRTRRIVFTPAVELKQELKDTSVIITCYDRDGNEVKRVTSADDGTVEEPDNTTETGENDGGNTSGSNSGNSGSGSVTQSVSAPTFSGNTQFTESTQVSMSGPAGAEIRYTTDGSQPTAQSTLYSGPLTLTETTTVKAIAIKDGQSSAVTSRTYTKGSNSGGGGGENGDMD